MPDTWILCGDVRRDRRGRRFVLELDASPDADRERRIGLELDRVARRFRDNIPDMLADLLEVAAYVYTADRLLGRGTAEMQYMAADWRRGLHFRIAVRCAEVWNRPGVQEALIDALSFLCEDNFTFDFVQTQRRSDQPFLGFSDPDAQVIQPDEIVLFSGGLDSTAGVLELLLKEQKQIALVSHRSAKFLVPKQTDLLARIRERATAGNLFHIPVWVTKGKAEPVEFNQRSRSLLFAALGMLAARMFGKTRILFCENGVTSFNLPIAEHVLGARASRTTHPRVLRSFERLFSLLFETAIAVENPFLWRTKADVVALYSEHGCTDLIRQTFSCAHVRNLPMTKKQCGVCFQCVERRFAVLAAGLGDADPPEGYATDLFRDAHTKVEDVTMAECHVLRAQRLATMSETAFFAAYGQVFRALSSLPGEASQNATRIFELHRRYGQYVVAVVDQVLRESGSLQEVLTLPPTSLLAMIRSPVGLEAAYVDPAEREPSPSEQARRDAKPIPRRRIVFAIDHDRQQVKFGDGPVLEGAAYELVRALGAEFQSGRMTEGADEKHAFVKTRELAARLGIDEVTLRSRVYWIRSSLKRQFVSSVDYILDQQDFIQNEPWKGYRLNPYLLLVDPAELRAPSAAS